MAKITEVHYGRTKSRNYQSERMELHAEVGEGEDWMEVHRQLKALVTAELFPEELAGVEQLETELRTRKRNLGLLPKG